MGKMYFLKLNFITFLLDTKQILFGWILMIMSCHNMAQDKSFFNQKLESMCNIYYQKLQNATVKTSI